MPFDVELGPLGGDRRTALDQEIRSAISHKEADYRVRFQERLPPCIAEPLAGCTEPLDHRSDAASVLTSLQDARDKLMNFPKKDDACSAWQRAEDVLHASRRARSSGLQTARELSGEAEELVAQFHNFIPPKLCQELAKG